MRPARPVENCPDVTSVQEVVLPYSPFDGLGYRFSNVIKCGHK